MECSQAGSVMDAVYSGSGAKDAGDVCLQFMNALLSSNCDAVKKLLDSGQVDVNEPIDGGPTPLVLAVIKQDVSLVKLLLENKASPNKTCLQVMSHSANTVTSPLQFAINGGNVAVTTMLINHGADPYSVQGGIFKILLFAVKKNSVDLVNYAFRSAMLEQEHTLLSEALHIAVSTENLAMVRLLVKSGASPNREHERMLPLTKAAYLGNIKLCKHLLSLGANLDGNSPTTPLSCAISTGFEKAVPVLLSLGCKVNKLLKWSQYSDDGERLAAGSSYLHLAIARHKFEAAKCLIQKGISMNTQDSEGNTALHIAARDSVYPESVKFLLDYVMPQVQTFRGRPPCIPKSRRSSKGGIQGPVYPKSETDKPLHIMLFSKRNFQGRTALMEAVISMNVEAVRFMVEGYRVSGALNITDNSGCSALHHAITADHEEMLCVLLEAGIDVNGHLKPAYPPLHTAVKKARTNMVPILLNYGANTNTRTHYSNFSLLHLAVEANCYELVTLFLEQGFDVNAKGMNGSTPLILAACCAQPEIVQALIDHGAKLNMQEYKQQDSALNHATYFGLGNSAAILLREGADPMLTDSRGSTVLDWCMFNCRPYILKLLIADNLNITLERYRSFPRYLTVLRDSELDEWITMKLSNPRSLQELCRIYLRCFMKTKSCDTGIVRLLNQLPLPSRIKDYLCYNIVEEGLNEYDFWASVNPDNLDLNSLSIAD